jgi:hypothetical protein
MIASLEKTLPPQRNAEIPISGNSHLPSSLTDLLFFRRISTKEVLNKDLFVELNHVAICTLFLYLSSD